MRTYYKTKNHKAVISDSPVFMLRRQLDGGAKSCNCQWDRSSKEGGLRKEGGTNGCLRKLQHVFQNKGGESYLFKSLNVSKLPIYVLFIYVWIMKSSNDFVLLHNPTLSMSILLGNGESCIIIAFCWILSKRLACLNIQHDIHEGLLKLLHI